MSRSYAGEVKLTIQTDALYSTIPQITWKPSYTALNYNGLNQLQ